MVVQAQWQGHEHLQIEIDGLSRQLLINVSDEDITLRSARGMFHYRCLDEQELALRDHAGEGAGECHAVATLPGQVVEINVKPGDKVSKGDVLVVLDSMKLLHELTAQRDGMVAAVFCEVSDSVDGGVMLIELTPDSPTNDN
jgi:3-methylcrotonyl-CoA carboxylase alpha subunit